MGNRSSRNPDRLQLDRGEPFVASLARSLRFAARTRVQLDEVVVTLEPVGSVDLDNSTRLAVQDVLVPISAATVGIPTTLAVELHANATTDVRSPGLEEHQVGQSCSVCDRGGRRGGYPGLWPSSVFPLRPGQPIELCACLAGLSRVEARQGREAACRAHAAEALALAERFGVGLYRLWAHLALTQLALGLGQLEETIGHGQVAAFVLRELGIADVDVSPSPELVETYVRQGRLAAAKALVDEYDQRAADKGLPWALARAARCRGLVADDASFEASFVEALRYHELTSDSFERARSHLCFGERLRRARRRTYARRELRLAFEIFDELGAAPWAERARLELLATGETAHRRGRDAVERLTPQEFQIAHMLAGGATTREAAARLFLSPKTVEYHLRNVYDKLGVRTRADLARVTTPIPAPAA